MSGIGLGSSIVNALAKTITGNNKQSSGTADKANTNTADRGYTNSSGNADRGYTNTTPSTNTATANTGGSYGGYGGYGGYSRSGGGGSSKPSKEDQEKLQATVDNLGDIYGRKKGDLEKQTKNALNVIKQKQKANNAALKSQQSQINRNVDWQPQQQKEQSMMMALRNRMGNAAYGSGIVDLMEGMGRVDDMADTQLINTWKQNMDNAYNNWFQADTELVGDYNEALADSQQKMSDLLSQYQAALNNVNPLAATTKNIKKAGKNVAKVDKLTQNLKNAKDAYKASKGKEITDTLPRTKAAVVSSSGKTTTKTSPPVKRAVVQTASKSKQKKLKDAVKTAEKKLDKARVSVGKGTEKINLPNIDMSPSAAFSKLMANKAKNASAVNPLTSDYVRPDRATTSLGGMRGDFNTAGNANSGFADNLRAFRRV